MPFALWFHKTSRSLSRTWTIEAVIKSIASSSEQVDDEILTCLVCSNSAVSGLPSDWSLSLRQETNKHMWYPSAPGCVLTLAIVWISQHMFHSYQITCEVHKRVDKVLTWRSNVVLTSHLIGHVSSTVWWCWVVENRGSSHHTWDIERDSHQSITLS